MSTGHRGVGTHLASHRGRVGAPPAPRGPGRGPVDAVTVSIPPGAGTCCCDAAYPPCRAVTSWSLRYMECLPMKPKVLLLAGLLCAGQAFAQTAAENCPELPQGADVTWDVV